MMLIAAPTRPAPMPTASAPATAAPSATQTGGARDASWGADPAQGYAPLAGELDLVDDALVPGLSLPKLPGLPGPDTPGVPAGKLLGPPAPGSIGAKADMLAVQAAQRLRTPEGDAWAVDMDRRGASSVWVDFAKRYRGGASTVQGWLGTALLAATMADNVAVTHAVKSKYGRLRPYQLDPSIIPAVPLPHGRSYPSGHASSAYAAARVIAALDPSLAAEAYGIAQQVAVSRVYAGVHFPSDVIAGALLGTSIADAVLRTVHKRP